MNFDFLKDFSNDDWSRSIRNMNDVLQDVDPNSFAPNRTANNTEKLIELMQAMIKSSQAESIKNRNRFIIATGIAAIAAIASIISLVLH